VKQLLDLVHAPYCLVSSGGKLLCGREDESV